MKKTPVILSLGLLFFIALSVGFQNRSFLPVSAKVIAVNGCTYLTDSKITKEIDLNKVDNLDIRNYYSALNGLSAEELSGTNLLKNLKPILYNMNYYSYDAIWKIYEITDRDWNLSPASEDSYATYSASSNSYSNYEYGTASNPKNNPYVRTLYRDHENPDGYIKEWGDHTNTGTNREHIWCQSRGFKADTGASGPAGTDLHHLRSGDGFINTAIHNNNPYGFIKSRTSEGNQSYTYLNAAGKALHTFGDLDESQIVFEPQDSDKGDIARAIFYMAARYNNYSGSEAISQFEPNLIIVNYATSAGDRDDSSATHPVGMGILQDLLVWNKIDPVDEFEIHRNDLIYRNYQGNRNPFIDFPQWADYIWGTATLDSYDPNPTGHANPQSDSINDASLSINRTYINTTVDQEIPVRATTIDGSDIHWEVVDNEICSIDKITTHSGDKVTVKTLKEGNTKIKVTATISGEVFEKEIDVKVYTPEAPAEPQKPNIMLYIIIGGAVGVAIVIAVIIYASADKKTKKKMVTGAKKIVKGTTTQTRKKSFSSSTRKKK